MMTSTRRTNWGREAVVAALTIGISIVAIPPVVAALAYQSGQAMFWPALQSLYTYFLNYTLLAGAGVATLVLVTRLVIRRLLQKS